jgi:hypothetical protein
MPKYTYQCKCGLVFNKHLSIEKAKEPQKCQSCGSMLDKSAPANLNGSFSLKSDSIKPQNTGVHAFDTNPDKVIAQHSVQSWGVMQERRDEKLDLMKSNKVTGDYIAHGNNGHYRVMPEEEKTSFQKNSKIVRELLLEQKQKSNQ